jgi:Peptidase family M28
MRSAFLVYFSLTSALVAQEPLAPSADRLKSDVKILSSDRFEGRAPGTRGEELTTEHIVNEFRKAGVKPIGERGTYYQPVPLSRIITDSKATLTAIQGAELLNFRIEEEFSGTSQTERDIEEFEAEAIFAGHGITAPEFAWDDYAGLDVKGKILVLFTNEPPSDDVKFFNGKALTYYGRYSYKLEEAARRGAKASFIIHTTETAGYPYSVVRKLDGAQLKREPGEPTLAFAGWLSRGAGEKLLALSGRTVDSALKEADTKGFRAVSLGLKLKANIPTKIEKITSNNVIGLIEGSDPVLKSEAMIFVSHWDHLGVGRGVLGDTIYNGAADNATGCAIVMEMARLWSAQTVKPKRSAIFLAVTAEEKGLLGSKYYAKNPIIPLGKTALNINFDMILPVGIPESMVLNGAERTTIWPLVQSVAKRHQVALEPDAHAQNGSYFRSDHFSFARAGVPGFAVKTGEKYKGKSQDFIRTMKKEFNDKTYHTPQDEFREDWDFNCFVPLIQFTKDLANEVGNQEQLPNWAVGDEFRPAREKSGVKP